MRYTVGEKGRESEEKIRCRISKEIAFEEFLKACGEDRESFLREVGSILGLEDEEIESLSFDELPEEITEEMCEDFVKSREWVLYQAKELIEDKIPFDTALRRSWRELREKCRQLKEE